MNRQFDIYDRPDQMSAEALLALGGPNIAFIKHIIIDGEPGYGIHSSDGTVLAVTEDREVAFAAARQHDLDPVSAH